jgi:hypothetical protein
MHWLYPIFENSKTERCLSAQTDSGSDSSKPQNLKTKPSYVSAARAPPAGSCTFSSTANVCIILYQTRMEHQRLNERSGQMHQIIISDQIQSDLHGAYSQGHIPYLWLVLGVPKPASS